MSDKTFRNTSNSHVGATKFDADNKPRGVVVLPGQTIVLSELEAKLTAEAPVDPKDNPFIGRQVETFDHEANDGEGAYVSATRPPLLEEVASDEQAATGRPVPAFGIDGADPWAAERQAEQERQRELAAEAEAAREKAASDAADAEARQAAEREAAEQAEQERQRQEAEAAAAREAAERQAAEQAERQQAERAAAAAAASQTPPPAQPPPGEQPPPSE